MFYVLQFAAAFFRLPAVFAVLLNGDSQVFLRLVDIPFTAIFGPCGY